MDKKYLITVLIIGLVIALALVLGGYYYLSYSQGSLSLKLPTPQPAVSPVPPVSQAIVTISSKGFLPQTLLVKKGSTVTWTNQDNKPHQVSSDPHPTHSLIPALGKGKLLPAGSSQTFTFTQPGTFTYHDEQNPLKFKGTIVVK